MLKRGGSGKRAMRIKKRASRIGKVKVEDLVLPASRLKFTPEQLQNLNFIFQEKLDGDGRIKSEENIILARSVTERLVQRLVCGVGILDPKFSSKYLINLHENDETSSNLQYLLRLDSLSKPVLYPLDLEPKYSVVESDPDVPKGYARIRMFSSLFKLWGDYANPHGYLRRDKIQARYVELLASAASSESPGAPNNLEESVLCASPGKILDASTLRNVFKHPACEHVFYGANGSSPRFPDPRDFRLAIVDEPDGIRLRVEFLSPALSSVCMNVRLLIGIEGDAWPSSTDFPARIPLGHSDSLLYQTAAQTGFYLVGYGVQSSAWQIRFPAAEETLLKDYGPNSTVKRILMVLHRIMNEVYVESERHQKYQYAYRILNTYLLKTSLLYELEKDFNSPTSVIINWSPQTLSVHVLKILDHLITSLRRQKHPNYFFPDANLLANPGHLCEDDYFYEAKRVLAYVVNLFNLSLISTAGNEDFGRMVLSQELEMSLLCKWKELVDGLVPPSSTRGRRFCFAGTKSRREIAFTQYTGRQLEYIGLLLKNVLNVKKNLLRPLDETWDDYVPSKEEQNGIEDVIYVLLTVIGQAKEHYLRNNPDKRFKQKLIANYDASMLKLAELIRKSGDSVEDDTDLVKVVLKWLYRTLDQNKRLLAPVLRPYLSILFISSHGNSWFLESLKKRRGCDEAEALGVYARLVNEGRITPAVGLVDCVKKNWVWAREAVGYVERDDLRLVFVGGRGKTSRHVLSAPKNTEEKKSSSKVCADDLKFSTLPKKSYFCTLLHTDKSRDDKKIPWHCVLRDNSPLTKIFEKCHRKGDHRCGGDIVKTLISMQKLNILQEISTILPEEDRVRLQELLQKYTNAKKKNTIRKKSQTLPNFSRKSPSVCQRYTRREESAGIKSSKRKSKTAEESKNSFRMNTLDLRRGSLIETCRAARIKEDSSCVYDSASIRSLIKSKDLFKNQLEK